MLFILTNEDKANWTLFCYFHGIIQAFTINLYLEISKYFKACRNYLDVLGAEKIPFM